MCVASVFVAARTSTTEVLSWLLYASGAPRSLAARRSLAPVHTHRIMRAINCARRAGGRQMAPLRLKPCGRLPPHRWRLRLPRRFFSYPGLCETIAAGSKKPRKRGAAHSRRLLLTEKADTLKGLHPYTPAAHSHRA